MLPIPLLLAFIFAPVNAFHQQPLSDSLGESSIHGTLRRFALPRRELQQILNKAQNEDLDIWQATPDWVDIYTSPTEEQPKWINDYVHTSTSIPAQQQPVADYKPQKTNYLNSTFHSTYHPLFEIDAFIAELAANYSSSVEVFHVGITSLGRNILGMKIQADETVTPKRTFIVLGPQHSREWAAMSTSLYLAHALLVDSSEKGSLRDLLKDYVFYIIPVPNPDGYVYTWSSDRFWYKNRMVTDATQKCIGIDMNRNWAYKWDPEVRLTDLNATAASPCSHSYPGHYPFEAPEVIALSNFLNTLNGNRVFLNLRAYGQMFSIPYSFSCKKLPVGVEDQMEAAVGAISALRETHGTPFVTGHLCNTFYRAHGNMLDWVYAKSKVKYSFTAHLRDTGTYGFALPAAQIRPVGEETANAIKYLARFIIKRDKKP